MSTPTTHPLGASKPTPRSTGSVFTPSASSPSRSVPSPAHLTAASHAQKAGKSPLKSAPSTTQTPLAGAHGTHTPTPPSGTAPGSSPATGLDSILGRARAGTLGAKSVVGSPAAHTPALSGLGLTLTPSGQGLNVSGQLNGDALLEGLGLGARDAEAWNAQRTREVAQILGTRWGRVSQENVERCLDRIGGLDCIWEDPVGGKEKTGERRRTFTIAGKEMMVDIMWVGERVVRVVLNFIRGENAAADDVGGEILLKDLVGRENRGGGYVSLDRFVENLSRLARIDQLGRGKVSCFEALEGVGDALKKLWELEVTKEKAESGDRDDGQAGLRVLCERSGRPTTHSDDKIGLKLDYWVDQRAIASKRLGQRAEEASLVPGSLGSPFTLLIDCEAFDATQYPPIRISNSWLADTAADALSDQNALLWQDPAPTFIPGTQVTGGEAMDLGISTGTQPDVRFVARLNPPVTLPLAAAIEIFNHVGQPLLQESIESTTFASLLFPHSAQEAARAMSPSKDTRLRFDRTVRSYDAAGASTSTRQRFNFFSQHDSWARTVHEIPFSHPRQLIDILPYLRQWAFFGNMLRRSFGVDDSATSGSGKLQMGASAVAEQASAKPPACPTKPLNGYRRRYEAYEPPSDTDSDDEQPQQKPPTASGNPAQKQAQAPLSARPQLPAHARSGPPPDVNIDTSFSYAVLAHRIDLDITVSFPVKNASSDSSRALNSPFRRTAAPMEACTATFRIHPNAKLETEQGGMFDDGDEGNALGTKWSAAEIRERIEKLLRLGEDLGLAVAWVGGQR